MSAIKVDTLAIAKELEEAGIPVKQAEAQTRVYAKVINLVVEDQLATKQDLICVERNLSSKLDEGNSRLEKKIDTLEKLVLKLESDLQTQVLKITVRLGSLLVAGIVVLAALIKF